MIAQNLKTVKHTLQCFINVTDHLQHTSQLTLPLVWECHSCHSTLFFKLLLLHPFVAYPDCILTLPYRKPIRPLDCVTTRKSFLVMI